MRTKSEPTESQDIKNLWGILPMTSPILAPVAILKRQGGFLAKATKGLLKVATSVNEDTPIYTDEERKPPLDQFRVTMYIVATALNNYRFCVLRVIHGIELYPARINAGKNWFECATQEDFENALEQVLQSDRVRTAIAGMMAQMQSN